MIGRYFSASAPFSPSEKKKHEFPDAFALLSLEEWAAASQKYLLCVSTDSGWQDFCRQSEHLICVAELDPVLDQFNQAGRIIAEKVLTLLRLGQTPNVRKEIEGAFEYRLNDSDFDVSVADAPTAYEFYPISATLISIDWSGSAANVLFEDEDTVTFSTSVKAQIEFTVEFEFFVGDSVDKDDVSIGSEELSTKRWIPFDLALTVSRDTTENVEAVDATVSRRGMTAIFDRIYPFSSENPTYDKY